MEPTGFGNPPPVFLCRDCHVQTATAVGKDGAHLKLSLLRRDTLMDGIAFQMGAKASQHLDRIDVIFEPQKNEFRGKISPQVQVTALRSAQGTAAVPADTMIFPSLLQELKTLSSNESTIPESEEEIQTIPRTRVVRRERGTLLIGHSAAQAAVLAAEMELDVQIGRVPDPRGFNTLLLAPDLSALEDVWQQIGKQVFGTVGRHVTRCSSHDGTHRAIYDMLKRGNDLSCLHVRTTIIAAVDKQTGT